MAEKSILWTTGATGDGATAYTQAEVTRWQRQFFVGADNEGVAKDYLNELATTGTATPVATNTGAAYVYGFPYWNTASVDTAIPTPSGNTRIDRLVLRAGWAAQTIRITRIAGTEGSGTPPAITQTASTTWDNPLYQASITTGGVITLTDEREFLHPNIAINTDMLDDDAVTVAKMAVNSVDSDQYVDGSIDLAHMSVNSVDSDQYVDGSIDLAHMSANSVDSDQYVDGSIDTAHLANNAVDDTKAGNRVPQFYRRQGGHATEWNVTGVTSYTPGMVRMQAGSKEWTGAANTSGALAVTFPVAFSDKPIGFANCLGIAADDEVNIVVFINSNTTMTLYWKTIDTSQRTSLDFSWLAIGPE